MTNEEFKKEVMSNSNLERICYSLFDKKMKIEDVCCEIAGELSILLHTNFKRDYNYEEIKDCLRYLDKQLFVGFRDGTFTLAQLKARVANRRGFGAYKVFDDIYKTVEQKNQVNNEVKKNPNMAEMLFGNNPKPEDYNRQLEPWESNMHCLRSIKYHHKKKRGHSALT